VVIGAGAGGYVAALRAAHPGLRTTFVSRGPVGGRCLNEACIPATVILRSADVLSAPQGAEEFAIAPSGLEITFPIPARRRDVISTLTHGVGTLLKMRDIEAVAGGATLTAAA
jgi:dihydrolipoamide dehydrogenase